MSTTVNPMSTTVNPMSTTVNPMSTTVNAPTLAHQSASRPTHRVDGSELGPDELAKMRKVEEAAKGFEQLFVQQLLKTARFASKVGSDGYGSMALEAMATGVTQGGGMGLANMIRDSLISQQLTTAPARDLDQG